MKNDEERDSVTIDPLMILLGDECHYGNGKVGETADGFASEPCITTAEAIR